MTPPLKPDASMKPDAELRVGDRVEITLTIAEIGDLSEDKFPYRLEAPDKNVAFGDWASAEFVHAGKLLPRPLAVGDRVRVIRPTGTSLPAEVLAIIDSEAWVRWLILENPTSSVVALSDLERA